MKTLLALLLTLISGIMLVCPAAATLLNPSFDDGLNGWGSTENEDPLMCFIKLDVSGGNLRMFIDNEGYLELGRASVFQTFYADKGTTLTGLAKFLSYCFSNHGFASVTVNGASVWQRDGGDVPPPPDDQPEFFPRTLGWEEWQYVIPADGLYTISFNLSDACQYGQAAEFDGVVVTNSVPDTGSTLSLFSLALAGIARLAVRRGTLTRSA